MISTVTTSTITTVTATGIAAGLGLIAILTLLGLLITRELAGASEQVRLRRAGQYLLVGIAPLFFVFAVIVVARVATVLN